MLKKNYCRTPICVMTCVYMLPWFFSNRLLNSSIFLLEKFHLVICIGPAFGFLTLTYKTCARWLWYPIANALIVPSPNFLLIIITSYNEQVFWLTLAGTVTVFDKLYDSNKLCNTWNWALSCKKLKQWLWKWVNITCYFMTNESLEWFH